MVKENFQNTPIRRWKIFHLCRKKYAIVGKDFPVEAKYAPQECFAPKFNCFTRKLLCSKKTRGVCSLILQKPPYLGGWVMRNYSGHLIHFQIFLYLTIFGFYPHVSFAAKCEKPIAKIVSAQGSVEVQHVGNADWKPVVLNETFCPGDKLRTDPKSRAEIALDKSILRLNANTLLTLKNVKENNTALIDLLKGIAYFFSLAPKSLEVTTPFAIAAVRGTEFLITVTLQKTLITIYAGKVFASNSNGSLILKNGQSAIAESGQAPVLQVRLRPQDAVAWTLYYPPVINIQTEGYPEAIRQSIQYYQKGNIKGAFDSIENAPEFQDPKLLNYLASLELSVGQVEAANKYIQKTLSIDPKNSEGLALQSIIALTQNNKEEALSKAKQAVQANSQSATAQIALSYAHQARFDMNSALASGLKAVELEPQNALAWARLAELWSAKGYQKKALEAAQKAVSLNPNLARTQTVLGFAHLTNEDTSSARTAFQKAIELDQADPLPKLGQGMAKIRDGELEEGRKNIEEAVNLDPNNSLMRSYLGKAYYDEKRSVKALEQFSIAKKQDPKDPTPLFYSAIEKQTTNRPVEALHDLQKAIDLNNNRAPFRSQLLMDKDLASRSSAVGRIYTDLNFQNRALLEGWLSLATDPTNFSAHRLLADSYSILPRHEIARVSELLQSQLLQLVNMTPIQPRLGESNLLLISSGGPGALSFNELNPLFQSNGITFQGNGIAGENDTYSGEGIISGIFGKASFSVGYSKFDTNGWRPNADQEDDIVNVFTQFQISHLTSVQFEYRFRETVQGDIVQRFFSSDFQATLRNKDTTNTARLGFHHVFMPGLDVIGNFSYQNMDRELKDPFFSVELMGKDKSLGGELQMLFRSKYINMVTGGGFFYINIKETFTFTPFPPEISDFTQKHSNFYLYSYIKILKNLTLTIGGSGDFFNTDNPMAKDKNQFNPKIGVVWEPLKGTTIRGAWFRVLKRTLVAQQTIEPTQIAGFNQFFDELNGTDYWVRGVGIDQKFTKSFYGGIQFTEKDLDVPILFSFPPALPQLNIFSWEEKQARAYLFWTPHQWVSLSAEWIWERLDRESLLNLNVRALETHYFPMKVNFFHPCGLSLSIKETYVNQKGTFNRLTALPGVLTPGKDSFWLTDIAIKYRFPKRYGFLTAGATNLFDESFQHFDPDLNNTRIQPVRAFFISVTLTIP